MRDPKAHSFLRSRIRILSVQQRGSLIYLCQSSEYLLQASCELFYRLLSLKNEHSLAMGAFGFAVRLAFTWLQRELRYLEARTDMFRVGGIHS